MSEATTGDAFHAFVTEIVRQAVPLILSEIAPHLVTREDEVLPVERAPEVGLTRRVLEDAIRGGEIEGIKLGRKLAAKRTAIIAWRDARAFQRRPRKVEAPANDHAQTLADIVAADFARMTTG